MVLSSVGWVEFDSAEAPGPVNARLYGAYDWELTRCEIICEERIARSAARSNLSLQSFALEQGSGSELGDG